MMQFCILTKNLRYLCISLLMLPLFTSAKTCLIFGAKGWIGKKLVAIIQDRGDTVICAASRLEQREAIIQEIITADPDYIINSAGIIGRPNVNWCEDHKQETIRSNVLGLLNLVDIAYLHGIHVTNIATGCIYTYDTNHPMGSGIAFTEEEAPNFGGSFYSHTKILVEKLICEYPNLLQLRVRLPIASDLSTNSFVGKIIQYKKLVNIPNSMSILEDLLPLVPQMIDRNLTGIYNFVNPGTLSHNEVIELYKQYINPLHTYENFSIEEQNELLKVPRSHCHLSANKLLREFPDVPNLKDSIHKIFLAMKQNVQ